MEEPAFLVFAFLTNVEARYRAVIAHDAGPDFARLALSVGKDGGGVGDNRRIIGGNHMI